MPNLGDFALGKTFDFKFTTVNSSGAPTQLAGSPVISAYPDNSTTQITAGITLTVDFDAVTGLNHVRVVATSGNGYATATNYDLVITTGTVGGTSVVGYVVGQFSIEARSALRPTTADRTLDVSAGGEAGVDWANVGSPTTTLNLSGTTVKTATDVETDTADIQSRLPAALTAGGNIKADALAISGDTVAADNAEAFFDGTGYAGTNNVIPTVTTLTNLPAITANWLTAAGTAADFGTEIGAAVLSALGTGTWASAIPWNSSWDAEVQSEVQDAIEVNHLDHLIAAADPGGVVANSSFLAKLVSKSATPAFSSFDNTTDSLEAIRDNHPTNFSSLSISIGGVKIQPTNTIGDSILTDLYIPTIADAIWDEVLSGHLTAGTTGAALSTASGTLDAAGVRTAVGLASANLDTQLSGIAADLPQRVTKNTALSGFTFPMVLASDHVTGATGKTVTATRSIDGAAFASCANSVSEVSGGFYKIDLAASDLNGNTITLLFTATACDPTRVTIITQPT